MNLSILAGPAIGAVIGYFTNYIAVKMLFRPLYPVKIGNYTLPFTPGIIPKGRGRLAKALGNAVGNTLLTEEDMKKTLLSDKMMASLDQIVEDLYQEEEAKSVRNYLLEYTDEEAYEDGKEILTSKVTDLVMGEMEKLPIAQWIAEKGTDAVLSNLDGFLAMMISADMVRSLVGPAGQKIEDYIKEEGGEILLPIIKEKVDALEEETPGQILDGAGISKEVLKSAVKKVYESFIEKKLSGFLEKININQIVENKINEMPMEDIEELVLSIMKKELGAVVNLGAVIGFLIGILNVFV